MNVLTILEGKKTYFTAAVLLLVVILEKGLRVDVPGVEISSDWLLIVLNAFGLGSLRAAIGK